MTTVLTIPALDLGIDRGINYMRRICKGWAVAEGRRQVQVHTSGLLDPSAGDNPRGAIAQAANRLNTLIRLTSGPKVVLAYSQGAQIAGTWMRNYADNPHAPDPAELSFILLGNPERRFGKQPWTKKITPDTTQYRVRDVARRHDNWADYDPKVHPKTKLAAMFGSIHTNYWGVDLEGPNVRTIQKVGLTEYQIVP